MPNLQSGKKELRKSLRRQKANKSKKTVLKKTIKEFKNLAKENKEAAAEKLSLVYKKLDKAAKANLIKKNKASRLKSRLSKHLKVDA